MHKAGGGGGVVSQRPLPGRARRGGGSVHPTSARRSGCLRARLSRFARSLAFARRRFATAGARCWSTASRRRPCSTPKLGMCAWSMLLWMAAPTRMIRANWEFSSAGAGCGVRWGVWVVWVAASEGHSRIAGRVVARRLGSASADGSASPRSQLSCYGRPHCVVEGWFCYGRGLVLLWSRACGPWRSKTELGGPGAILSGAGAPACLIIWFGKLRRPSRGCGMVSGPARGSV